MSKLSRAFVNRIAPTNCPLSDELQSEAVVDLIHHVLPALTHRYLRKFMRHEGVRTLVLLLPEDMVQTEDAQAVTATNILGSSSEDEQKSITKREDPSSHEASASDEDANETSDDEEDEDEPELTRAPLLDPAARALMKKRVAGAVCYEMGERLGEKLIQVSLLAVRIRYQRLGVGSRLIRAVLSGEASIEKPEAALAWADTRAIPFFKRHGFTDDPLLNARYREISQPWARSTLMSAQLPPAIPDLSRGGSSSGGHALGWVGGEGLNESLESWRKTRLLEYSKELCLIERMHQEIRSLRDKVSVQNGHAAVLQAENQKLRLENAAMRKEFETYRRSRASHRAGDEAGGVDGAETVAAPGSDNAAGIRAPMDDIDLTDSSDSQATRWLRQAEEEVAREAQAAAAARLASQTPGPVGTDPSGSPNHQTSRDPVSRLASIPVSPSKRGVASATPVAALHRTELEGELLRAKPGASGPARLLSLTRWLEPSPESAVQLQTRFATCQRLLNEPSLVLRLFYGAPIAELQGLLQSGFQNLPTDPHGLSVYGRGWYFSKYATHAQHYAGGDNCVLLAEVAVGNTETVVRKDSGRGAPAAGFDSMVVPGRRLPAASGLATGRAAGEVNEEYVVFDGSQARPLCLLFFDEK